MGLVSVFPPGVFVVLALLTVSFCLSVTRRPLNPVVPLIHVVVLVVVLYGVTSFVEAEPRVAQVYKHLGVMDYILHHGSVDPTIDAYFNWPGFFALGAVIGKAAGFRSLLDIGAWGPITFNLLFLAPLMAIFRWASDDRRVMWLGLWVFYSTNWVAQDHVAPQALGYLLWLAILAALLTWFAPRPRKFIASRPARGAPRRGQLLRRLRERVSAQIQTKVTGGTAAQRAGVLLMVAVMYAAIVVGHQLTPLPALITVLGLVVFARLETRRLPLIMGVFLVAWIVYMTTNFLEGNYRSLLGHIGDISQNVDQGVAGRFVGSPDHEFIVQIRVWASAVIWLLALGGFIRRVRRGWIDVAAVVVAGAPFLLPILQPYGGEIFLRVFLFALPAVALFIAFVAFPSDGSGRTWMTPVATVLIGCVLLGFFQYTRYGNERLDNFTRGDLALVQKFYRAAPHGSVVFAGVQNLPWRYQNYDDYDYHSLTELKAWTPPKTVPNLLTRQLEEALRSRGGGYVIITRSTEIAAELFEGKPGLLEAVASRLRHSKGVRVIYTNRDGELFYVRARRGARRSAPYPLGESRPLGS